MKLSFPIPNWNWFQIIDINICATWCFSSCWLGDDAIKTFIHTPNSKNFQGMDSVTFRIDEVSTRCTVDTTAIFVPSHVRRRLTANRASQETISIGRHPAGFWLSCEQRCLLVSQINDFYRMILKIIKYLHRSRWRLVSAKTITF